MAHSVYHGLGIFETRCQILDRGRFFSPSGKMTLVSKSSAVMPSSVFAFFARSKAPVILGGVRTPVEKTLGVAEDSARPTILACTPRIMPEFMCPFQVFLPWNLKRPNAS